MDASASVSASASFQLQRRAAPTSINRTHTHNRSNNHYHHHDHYDPAQSETGAAQDAQRSQTFDAIFRKYEHDFTEVTDEIDLETGEIVVDNGHFEQLPMQGELGSGLSESHPLADRVLDELQVETDDESHGHGRISVLDDSEIGSDEDENTAIEPVLPGNENSRSASIGQALSQALSSNSSPEQPLAKSLVGEGTAQKLSEIHDDGESSSLPQSHHVGPSEAVPPDTIKALGISIADRLATLMALPTKEKRSQFNLNTTAADPLWHFPELPQAKRAKRQRDASPVGRPTWSSPGYTSPNARSLWAVESDNSTARKRQRQDLHAEPPERPVRRSGRGIHTSEGKRCWNCSLTRSKSWLEGPHGQDLCSSCGQYFYHHGRMKAFDSPTPPPEENQAPAADVRAESEAQDLAQQQYPTARRRGRPKSIPKYPQPLKLKDHVRDPTAGSAAGSTLSGHLKHHANSLPALGGAAKCREVPAAGDDVVDKSKEIGGHGRHSVNLQGLNRSNGSSSIVRAFTAPSLDIPNPEYTSTQDVMENGSRASNDRAEDPTATDVEASALSSDIDEALLHSPVRTTVSAYAPHQLNVASHDSQAPLSKAPPAACDMVLSGEIHHRVPTEHQSTTLAVDLPTEFSWSQLILLAYNAAQSKEMKCPDILAWIEANHASQLPRDGKWKCSVRSELSRCIITERCVDTATGKSLWRLKDSATEMVAKVRPRPKHRKNRTSSSIEIPHKSSGMHAGRDIQSQSQIAHDGEEDLQPALSTMQPERAVTARTIRDEVFSLIGDTRAGAEDDVGVEDSDNNHIIGNSSVPLSSRHVSFYAEEVTFVKATHFSKPSASSPSLAKTISPRSIYKTPKSADYPRLSQGGSHAIQTRKSTPSVDQNSISLGAGVTRRLVETPAKVMTDPDEDELA